jgi:nicotinate-nucleotide--dimethylbenzimidazole phosphoribosyltransferase
VRLLEETVEAIQGQDREWRHTAKDRLAQLIMPSWAMGRLMDVAVDLAGIRKTLSPGTTRKRIVVMAGDHGVCQEGVSLYPQEVTVQMVRSFARGGATISALADVGRIDVTVVDMGIAGDLTDLFADGKVISRRMGPGTANIAEGPAMSRETAVNAIEAGIALASEMSANVDVFGTGDMGIGNTTPSAAISAAITGRAPVEVTGKGTGLDDKGVKAKVTVIERALMRNQPESEDGLDVLSKVGGFEIGGLTGLILGACRQRKPVLIDGFISTAAALVANTICPVAMEFVFAAHRSAEPGHRIMLSHLDKEPLLDLGLRLGEGTGVALAMPLIDSAASLLNKVLTFEEAAVSEASA